MIDLVFGESAAGALKYAKSMKPGQPVASAYGVIGEDISESKVYKMPKVWESGEIEGQTDDVSPLNLYLDIGSLSGMAQGHYDRSDALELLFGDFPDVKTKMSKTNSQTLARLKSAESTNEHIRIWLCEDDPAEHCALLFVCAFIPQCTNMTCVKIPSQVEEVQRVVTYHSTSEVPAEMFAELLQYERPLTGAMRSIYATMWADLIRENSPLRAVVNGKIMGVPEDFYDFIIYNNIPEGEFVCARLIGKVLSYTPGIGDRWIHNRIESMIALGILREVTPADDDHPYSAVLEFNS